MTTLARSVLSALTAAGLTASIAVAQDAPGAKLNLLGTYEVANARVGEESVSVDFKATVTNLGDEDVSGPVVLRDVSVIQKVWERFGDQSIPAGKSVTVSASVTVPRVEYDSWSDRGPGLFFYTENDRGEIKTFRIPLSRIGPKAS